MRMRWFGEPWPSTEERASVCDNDDFSIEAPVGEVCVGCGDPICEHERGVVMGSDPILAGSFGMSIDEWDDVDESWMSVEVTVVAEHIDCLIMGTAGPEFADLIDRVPKQHRKRFRA